MRLLIILSLLYGLCLAFPQQSIEVHEEDLEEEVTTLEPEVDVRKPEVKDICLSKQCIEASHRIFQKMNETANPCDDFSEFACGRFFKEQIIPDDKGSYGSFTVLRDIVDQRARILLEEPIDEKKDWESHQNAKLLYKSCVDTEKRDKIGVKPIKDILQKDLGGWPVLEGEKWNDKDYNVWDQQLKAYKLGFSEDHIVDFGIIKDSKDTSKRVLYLDQTSLGLKKEYLDKGKNEPEVKAYFKYMVDTAVLFGADESKATKELSEVLEFEMKLANISTKRELRRNKTLLYNPTTIDKIAAEPGFPESWKDYVQALLDFPGVKIPVEENEIVIIRDTDFFKNVSKVISKTSDRVLANYLGWRVAAESMKHLTSEALAIRHKFRKSVYGTQQQKPTWITCVQTTGFSSYSSSNFVYAASSMYAMRYFKPEDKQQMFEMTQYLRKAFSEMVDDLKWMDDKTKVEAHRKLKAMDQYLAYPDEILNEKLVNEVFKGLEIKGDDYLGNILRMSQHFNLFHSKKLREIVDPKDWKEHQLVAVVNAFYNPNLNNFEFPAGILQGNFFDPHVPKYLNYGAIGVVIGHEITHGFDDQGRQRNADGELQDWWDPATNARFKEKAQCIIDQYGNFSSKQVNLNLNGINTQGENIADNGGVKEAYLGYSKWVQDHGVEPGLPGHPYSSKQLFWVSFAQVWCTKYRDRSIKNSILTGVHSPGPFRIIGALQNNDDFSRDFDCPRGSKMNPEQKCNVW